MRKPWNDYTSPIVVIEIKKEVQDFLDQIGNVMYASGAKIYIIDGVYYCATNEPEIFIIPNTTILQNYEDKSQRPNY